MRGLKDKVAIVARGAGNITRDRCSDERNAEYGTAATAMWVIDDF